MHVCGAFTLHQCTHVVIAFAHAAHMCVPLKLCVICTESNKVHTYRSSDVFIQPQLIGDGNSGFTINERPHTYSPWQIALFTCYSRAALVGALVFT